MSFALNQIGLVGSPSLPHLENLLDDSIYDLLLDLSSPPSSNHFTFFSSCRSTAITFLEIHRQFTKLHQRDTVTPSSTRSPPSKLATHAFLQFLDRINSTAVLPVSHQSRFSSCFTPSIPVHQYKYLAFSKKVNNEPKHHPRTRSTKPHVNRTKSKMRSSTILTLLGATLAVATPLAHDRLHKKAYVYDIVTDVVYVTVTEGELPATPTTVHLQHTVYVNPVEATSSTHTKKVEPTTSEKPTSTYVPPPPPTTSTTPPPAPTTTTEAPAPTTEAAPVETTTQAPVEVPATTSAAPVVEVAATTAEAVASSTPATSSDSFTSTGVNNHNTCRSSHSAENVSWNETLASYAAITAATCVFAHDM